MCEKCFARANQHSSARSSMCGCQVLIVAASSSPRACSQDHSCSLLLFPSNSTYSLTSFTHSPSWFLTSVHPCLQSEFQVNATAGVDQSFMTLQRRNSRLRRMARNGSARRCGTTLLLCVSKRFVSVSLCLCISVCCFVF